MAYFKYYRDGQYLDKAIRYNELYYSENHELNDPNDLKAFFVFEDSEELWSQVLALKPPFEAWDLRRYIDVTNRKLFKSLNDLFKGKIVKSNLDAIKKFVEEHHGDLHKICTENLSNSLSDVDKQLFGGLPDNYVAMFVIALSELLSRAATSHFSSVSFSRDPLSPMMWAHYADGFKGCVIIYGVINDQMPVCENIYSNQFIASPIHKVDYVNSDKNIPLLASALGEKDAVLKAHLLKNEFWKYEKEHRMFRVSQASSVAMAMAPDERMIKMPWGKIYHHHPDTIQGIIFGPKFNEHRKNSIEWALRQQRIHTTETNFFVFDTILTSVGDIEITEGKMCIVDTPGQLSRQYKGSGLEQLLKQLNVFRPLD